MRLLAGALALPTATLAVNPAAHAEADRTITSNQTGTHSGRTVVHLGSNDASDGDAQLRWGVTGRQPNNTRSHWHTGAGPAKHRIE
ncbi:hypothetical protein KZZ52_41965 [Dactylosporangium sp. AC04546]|uniref:hypothetical protein n=1 Tax=Dactylosporangium sp. AC04546 TaxID=2862460 RepID=UPI001EDD7CAB|nr:hypothetical protein [Dactylosporangium sp. AC04546]WVK80493.1 hypothetical protein KZZ52_41965 [Dactylosporangium sp. AC04546]